jgi:cytochrome c oxidase cbb3-type subunit 4
MFKFIKQYAETIDGINIYPMVSLLIFVLFFIAVLWYVKKMDAGRVDEIKNLPLADDNSYVTSIKKV